jgi:hypothetical protein
MRRADTANTHVPFASGVALDVLSRIRYNGSM